MLGLLAGAQRLTATAATASVASRAQRPLSPSVAARAYRVRGALLLEPVLRERHVAREHEVVDGRGADAKAEAT